MYLGIYWRLISYRSSNHPVVCGQQSRGIMLLLGGTYFCARRSLCCFFWFSFLGFFVSIFLSHPSGTTLFGETKKENGRNRSVNICSLVRQGPKSGNFAVGTWHDWMD